MEYYILLEKLVKALNRLEEVDTDKLGQLLKDLCGLFRIAALKAEFYENLRSEELGRGHFLTLIDNSEGREIKEVYNDRYVSIVMNVGISRIFMLTDSEPWTDEERDRIMTIKELVLNWVLRIRLRASVDRLTFFDDDGYRNLRSFFRFVNTKAMSAEGLKNRAAMHFNLKHFSLVNQQVGRVAGNIVIRGFYDGLAMLLNEDSTVCRVGGDSFVLMCYQDELPGVIKYLSGTAVVYNANTGDKVKVSANIGVFVLPDNFVYENEGDIMDRILSASNAARSSLNTDIVYFNEAMVASKERILLIQKLFGEALEKEEYKVFYQPKIDIGNGELIGAEALCRWFHDDMIVPPMDFIPVLEQDTSICRLDFYMLDHVCRDIRRWLDEGKNVVRVSVNLSRKHMMDMDLLQHIIEIVDRNNVPHEYIEIELTETTTDVEFKDLKRVVNGLQLAGICTSVDDFGMGYSSLNLIKEIPWNVLKVDRSFLPVDEDNDNSTRSVMFKYVVAMAREMGLECIAEGVETRAQVEVLRNNSCELAQGFFFDKPLPITEFEDRLNKHRYAI